MPENLTSYLLYHITPISYTHVCAAFVFIFASTLSELNPANSYSFSVVDQNIIEYLFPFVILLPPCHRSDGNIEKSPAEGFIEIPFMESSYNGKSQNGTKLSKNVASPPS